MISLICSRVIALQVLANPLILRVFSRVTECSGKQVLRVRACVRLSVCVCVCARGRARACVVHPCVVHADLKVETGLKLKMIMDND